MDTVIQNLLQWVHGLKNYDYDKFMVPKLDLKKKSRLKKRPKVNLLGLKDVIMITTMIPRQVNKRLKVKSNPI